VQEDNALLLGILTLLQIATFIFDFDLALKRADDKDFFGWWQNYFLNRGSA
jgi:hypothetical protein